MLKMLKTYNRQRRQEIELIFRDVWHFDGFLCYNKATGEVSTIYDLPGDDLIININNYD